MTDEQTIEQLLKKIKKLENEVAVCRETENLLRKSEEKYRLLADNVTDVIFSMSLDMNHFTYISPSTKVMQGYTPEEMMKTSPLDHLTPESIEHVASVLSEELENEKKGTMDPDRTRTLELEEFRKDGSTISTEITCRFLRDDDGKPTGIMGMSRDISRRKKTEAALRASEEKYRMLFESSPFGLMHWDKDGIATSCNKHLADMLGTTTELVTGVRLHDSVKDEEIKSKLLSVLSGEKCEFESDFKISEKKAKTFRASYAPIYDANKQIQGCIGIVQDVTNQRIADEALKESELKYRTLVEHSLQGVIIIMDFKIHFANDAAVKIMGYSAEELLKLTPEQFLAMVHPDDRETFHKRHQDILQGKYAPDRYEFCGIQKDGSVIHLEVFDSLIEYQGKSAIQSVFVDITERKTTENALRESEEKFKTIFENANDLIVYVRPDSTVVNANEKISHFGYTPEEVIGKRFTEYEIFQFKELDRSIKHMNRTLSGNPKDMVEFKILCKDKTERFIEVNSRLIYEDDNPAGIINIIRDITSRKQAEIALRESEEKFKTIFENANDGIIYIDKNGIMTDMNYKMEQIFGYSRKEVLGKKFNEIQFLNEKSMEDCLNLFNEVVTGGKTPIREFEAINKYGETIFIEGNTRMIEKNGKPEGLLNIVRDITQRKKDEEERSRLIDMVETTTDFVSSSDLDGNITYINNAGRKMVGLKPDTDISGTMIADYHPKWVLQTVLEEGLPAAMRDGVWSGETALLSTDGKEFPTSQVIMAHKNREQKVWFFSTIIRDITKTKRAEEQIQALTRQLMKVQENERQRISLDLHDNVAQDLSTLKIACETLFDNHDNVPDGLQTRVKEMSNILRGTITSVRDLTYDLRPPSLDQLGLVQTIYQYCEDFSGKTGIDVDFYSAGMDNYELDFDTEINLYRIVQEGLNNIRRHAYTMQATVRLISSFPNIILKIEDNGRGFDPETRLEAAVIEKRMGLRSLQERTSLLKGKFSIQSVENKGTRINIEVPCKERKSG